MREEARLFPIGGDMAVGILHPGAEQAELGLLVIVGGPQYRVGSHRQFVLLARHLAAAGIPVFRFDYRGMGDAEGESRSFDAIDDDIRAAIEEFMRARPTMQRVILWGLCDGASAAVMYAPGDPRVAGLILLNPWVRTEQGQARAYLRHYYLQRLMSRDFWSGLVRGRLRVLASARDLGSAVASARGGAGGGGASVEAARGGTLPERMAEGWKAFEGDILLILSGNDLTAREFLDAAGRLPSWQGLLAEDRVTRHDLPPANHTFSSATWRNTVAEWTRAWIRAREGRA